MPRLMGNVILLKHASEVGNAIEDHDEESRAHVTRERESSVPYRHELKSANGRVSKSKRVQNIKHVLCRVCTVLKLIKWFIVCTCNLIIDQQPNVDMFQQPNFYSEQNDSPRQAQLLQKYMAHLFLKDNLMKAARMESTIYCQMN